MPRRVIIIRHAHRNKKWGDGTDNGLSLRGRRQAKWLRGFFRARFPNMPVAIYSSPKRRCVETVDRLAQGGRLATTELLDEGRGLTDRARRFLSLLRKSRRKLVVICSHGDWIPVFLKLATGVEFDLAKGGWVELEIQEGRFQIVAVIQDFRFFGR